jgi:hypothetical protein
MPLDPPVEILPEWSSLSPTAPVAITGAIVRSPATPPEIHTEWPVAAPDAPGEVRAEWSALSPTAPVAITGAIVRSPSAPGEVTPEWTPPTGAVATLTTALAGTNNDLVYTERGAGTKVSITYPTPAAQATTGVSVAGSAITVAPGTKARMLVLVGGDELIFVANGEMASGNDGIPRPVWTFGGLPFATAMDGENPKGRLRAHFSGWELSATNLAGSAIVETPSSTPDVFDEADWPDVQFASVSPLTSSAAQVKAAVEASTAASALVTVANASGNNGTGAVAAMATTYLSYRSGLVPPAQIMP